MQKILKYISIPVILLLFNACGYQTISSKEEAVQFLESNSFYDETATVTGKNGGQLKSSFSMKFSNGKAIINEEELPYSIEELSNGHPHFSGNGFVIEVCGSERYAYGGCIKCYLSGGFTADGGKKKTGPSLSVKGDYINAYFSYITKDGITKK